MSQINRAIAHARSLQDNKVTAQEFTLVKAIVESGWLPGSDGLPMGNAERTSALRQLAEIDYKPLTWLYELAGDALGDITLIPKEDRIPDVLMNTKKTGVWKMLRSRLQEGYEAPTVVFKPTDYASFMCFHEGQTINMLTTPDKGFSATIWVDGTRYTLEPLNIFLSGSLQ